MEEYVLTPLEDLQEIANAMREETNENKPIKFSDISKYVKNVSKAGQDKRDLEWWANYQGIGGTTSWYHYMFAGAKWNLDTFKPRYDIKNYYKWSSVNANYMFQNHNHTNQIYDLSSFLNLINIVLDTSGMAAMVGFFNAANVSRVPAIDITKISSSYNTYQMFASKFIETIDKLICCERTFDYYGNEFSGATALKNIVIEGVIANNKLNFSDCPLTHDSLISIINALKDFSGTTETRSITFGATNLAKLTDDEKLLATQKGWTLA